MNLFQLVFMGDEEYILNTALENDLNYKVHIVY